MSNKRKLYLIILISLLLILFFIDLNVGYKKISIYEIFNIIIGKASKSTTLIFTQFRLPRVITVLLIGSSLSVSGTILQTLTKNELADPGILGINAGAGLVVALMIYMFSLNILFSSFLISLMAFIGAIITTILIFGLSYIKGEGISKNRLILTGVAMSSALNAITIIILLRMTETQYGFIAGWLSGNLWGVSWDNILILAPCIILLLVYAIYKSRLLDVLNLGRNISTGLGVNVNRQTIVLLIVCVGLSGLCVAVGGGISFVGLVCPHIARKLFGSKHKILIPGTFLVGSVLLLFADIISRTIISPNELSIGIVVTIIGAPYFIYLLVSQKERS